MFAAPGVAGGGDRLQRMDLLEDGGARIEAFGLTVLEQVGDLIVDQTTLGADGGGEEAELRRYAAIATDQQLTAEGVAWLALFQGAEFVAQGARDHRDVAARQIDGEGALGGLFIDGAARRHIGGRIGDGDGQQPPLGVGSDIEGIVHILGGGAIDGDEGQGGQIFTGQILFQRLPALGIGRGAARQIVAAQHHPPGGFGIVAAGDAFADLGKVAAIGQAVALEVGDDPVPFGELFLVQPLDRAGLDHLLEHRMIRHHVQAILDQLDAADEAGQERGDQAVGLGLLFLVFGADQGCDAVTMHHLLHLLRRNEIALAIVGFQEAEAAIGATHDPLFFRDIVAELLFELRQQRIVLKHSDHPVEETCRLYGFVRVKPRSTAPD